MSHYIVAQPFVSVNLCWPKGRKHSSVKIPAHSASVLRWGCSGDLVIQVFFGARHVARLADWQGKNPGEPGLRLELDHNDVGRQWTSE